MLHERDAPPPSCLSAAAVCLVVALAGIHQPTVRAQQATGAIDGRVMNPQGELLSGVLVLIPELTRETTTDSEGRYRFEDLPSGSYALTFVMRELTETVADVSVGSGAVLHLETTLPWELRFNENVTVTAASRHQERIVDAPAAVTSVDRQTIDREAHHGQAPRLLGTAPGIQLAQASLHAFNVNVRGFNAPSNRRILTLVDGRDPTIPGVLGAMEWSASSLSLDEFERMELVYGPGAALYGAGAVNGVLDIRTRVPRDTQGGKLRFTVGELETLRVEGRYSGSFGSDWFFRAQGGYQRSNDFTQSRVDSVEYEPELLPTEAIPLAKDHFESATASFRLDKYLAATARRVTVEGGFTDFEGPTNPSPIGRVQQTDVQGQWFRFNFNSPRWNLLAAYTRRDSPDQAVLSSGSPIFLDSYNFNVELQANEEFSDGRGRVVGGVFLGHQRADSSDDEGVQTIYRDPVRETRGAIFGQIDYDFTPRLKGVASLRWDDSEVHDARLSPRFAIIYKIAPVHSLRLTFSDGFKRPTLSEFFARIPVAPPLDLSALETSLAPVLDGTPLGFENIPLLAMGNRNLIVEEIQNIEIGYTGVVARRIFLGVTFFRNRMKNFTTDFLPQVGTSFGKVNPSFADYRTPAALSEDAAATVLSALEASLPPDLFASMSNDTDGAPIFVIVSNTDYGRVVTSGVEITANYAVSRTWSVDASYTFLSFDVKDDSFESPLSPNAPRNQAGFGATFVQSPVDVSLRYHWVEAFPWQSGIFAGPVATFQLVDLSANYEVSASWSLGLHASNLFDNDHYELFGGDLIGRRVLVSATLAWR